MRILNILISIALLGSFGCAGDAAAKKDDSSQNPAVEEIDESEARKVQLETERSEPLMEAAEERNVVDEDGGSGEEPE